MYVDFRIEGIDKAVDIFSSLLSNTGNIYVGFTCYSCHYLQVLKLARIVKSINPQAVTVVGGFHPTILPGDFTFEGSPVDVIIRGEGEIPLYQLVRDSLGRRASHLITSGPLIDSFDDFPVVSFDLFEGYRERMKIDELPIYFSRGCSHDCSFCIDREATCGMKRYRMMPVSLISRQIAYLEEYGLERLVVSDPLFGLNNTWFNKITSLLGNRELPYRVKVEMHVDLMNEPRIQHCLENKIDLTVGFESASLQMLHLMNKTRDPIKYVEKAKSLISFYGDSSQELLLNILFGHPGENLSTLDETFQFLYDSIEHIGSFTPKASVFRLYPGTPVFDHREFFSRAFGSRFHLPNWWYQDIDHNLSPVLIDPSSKLTLESEILHLHETLESFLDVAASVDSVSMMKKVALVKYACGINKTYENLHHTIQDMKANIVSLNGFSNLENTKTVP